MISLVIDFFENEFYCEICSKWFSEESDLENHRQDHRTGKVIVENAKFYCNFCEETFINKKVLMEHKKRLPEERATMWWKFEAGFCDFGESSCWFSHCQNRKFKTTKIQK
jgi:hypothetical protein